MAVDFKDFQKLKWYYQVLVVAGAGGALLFLAWYQYPGFSQMATDIQGKQSVLEELQKTNAKYALQQANLSKLKKQTLELEMKLETLKSVLPLERETEKLLVSLPEVARQALLQVPSRINFRPPSDREVYTEHPIDMEVVGTYHNIGTFLDMIRNLPRIVNVSTLTISGRGASAEAARVTVGATLTATTFVYKEEAAAK